MRRVSMPAPGQPVSAAWAREVAEAINRSRATGGPGILVSEGTAGTTFTAIGAMAQPRIVPLWTRRTGGEKTFYFVGANPVYDADGALPAAEEGNISDGWISTPLGGPDIWLGVVDGKWALSHEPPAEPPPPAEGEDEPEKPFALQLYAGGRQLCFSPVCKPPAEKEEEDDGEGEGDGSGPDGKPGPPPCGHPGNLEGAGGAAEEHPGDEELDNGGGDEDELVHPGDLPGGVSPPSGGDCPPTETTDTTPENAQPGGQPGIPGDGPTSPPAEGPGGQPGIPGDGPETLPLNKP